MNKLSKEELNELASSARARINQCLKWGFKVKDVIKNKHALNGHNTKVVLEYKIGSGSFYQESYSYHYPPTLSDTYGSNITPYFITNEGLTIPMNSFWALENIMKHINIKNGI